MYATRNNNGFSLVELLVVVSIISLLSAISLPKFNQFKIRAGRTEAFVNVNIIYSMLEAYKIDNPDQGGTLVYYGLMDDPNSLDNDCGETLDVSVHNKLGFSVGDCRKLRYLYYGQLNLSSPGLPENYSAFAQSARFDTGPGWSDDNAPAGQVKLGAGLGIVGSACRINNDVGYWDQVSKGSIDGALTVTRDAIIQCR